MTDAPGPMPLGSALSLQAVRNPDRPALTMGDVSLTRAEVDRAANRLARDLANRGLTIGDRAAVVLPTGPAHQIACFALWKLGVTVIPLVHYAVDSELRHLVGLADPKIIIGMDPARLPDHEVLPVDYAPDPALDDGPLPEAIPLAWKASPSGGSTGLPKLIWDRTPGLVDPDNPMPLLRFVQEDIVLHPAPAHHNSPFCQTAFALSGGAHVILMPRFDAEEWLRLVEHHRVRWAYMVPTMMSRVLALPLAVREKYDVSSLQTVWHMAAPCPEWVKGAWIDWLGPDAIWEVYAGTEGYGASVITGAEWLVHRGSVGKPWGGCEIRDEANQPLPTDQIGTIYFELMPNMRRAGEDNWKTYGDMGWLDADGYLYIADRRTDVILTGGVNLYPAEIEAALGEHPSIATAVVIGLPDADVGARAHAVLELRPGVETLDPTEVQAYLRERLSPNKIPHSYEIVPGPLRDDAGKVRRVQIREQRMAMAGQFPRLR